MSKDSLIKGTLILALAAFVARFLGAIQRVPLLNMLGDHGLATYGIAYNIYFVLLTVATAGIPSTLSKMISERQALGAREEADRIYRAAIWFALSAGLVITVLLYLVAPYYADFSGDPDAKLAIWALAPAMLVFPLIAIMRGYFQGHQQMMPGGLSQIVEQIARVVTAVLFAYLLIEAGYSIRAGAAGASFGGVAGAAGALAVLGYYAYRHKRLRASAPATKADQERPVLTYREIYRSIFKLSIPISLISIAVPLINFIDSTIAIPLLEGQIGYDEAKETLGILTGRGQSLAGIPIIIAIALSMSIVPVVSSAYARKDMAEVNRQASQALRISILSGLPLVLMLSLGARPINGLLFPDTEGSLIIALLTVGSMLQIVMMTSGAILMGLGQTKEPMMHVFVGLAIKLVFSLLFGWWIGIYGLIAATALCFYATLMLNLRALKRTVDFTVLGRRWTGIAYSTALLTAVGLGLDYASAAWIHTAWSKLDYLLQAVVVCGVVGLLYPIALFGFKAMLPDDLRALPRRVQPIAMKIAAKLQR